MLLLFETKCYNQFYSDDIVDDEQQEPKFLSHAVHLMFFLMT